MLQGYYPGWDIEVATLGGVRRPREMLRRLLDVVVDEHNYYVVLIGREDAGLLSLVGEMPENVVVHMVPRSKVRNARLSMLARELEKAKATFRCGIG